MQTKSATANIYQDDTFGFDLRAAHYQAAQLGLCEADCEDCAMDYLVRKLLQHEKAPTISDAAWRWRCAGNFARNTRRARQTRGKYEGGDIDPEQWESLRCQLPSPEAQQLRQAFWDEMRLFIERLQPTPRALFLRHYRDGESVQALAHAFGENPHAVEQKLYRARRRLLALLERENRTAEDLHEFLSAAR